MQLTRFINIERLIHSLKTCIAAILAFALTKIINFPADQWIVITVIVVMCAQIYVGSVIQKSYLRFLGTLTGCLFASFMLIMYGHTGLSIASAIGIAAFVFSYIATGQENLTYAGTLGAVTTTIIMLGEHPTVTFAAERFMEISIGILIAALVSQFILPIHARTHLRRAQAETLGLIQDYYQAVMSSLRQEDNTIDYHDLDEAIVKTLLKQRQLAKESKREPLGQPFDPYDFSRSLFLEREILRAITFMQTALEHVKQAEAIFTHSDHAKAFNNAIINAFATLKLAANSNTPPSDSITIPSLDQIKQEIAQSINMPSREELIYIDGFLFSAEVMLGSLKKLTEMYNIQISNISSL